MMSILFSSKNEHEAGVEAYRILRTNLDFIINKKGIKSILITSAGPGSEGKSTISLNLSLSLAETEKEVVLVDADLRKPRIHKILKINQKPGLVEILQNKSDYEALNYRKEQGITALPSGEVTNSSPFIKKFAFRRLLERLEEKYDVVIVDSPPLIISDSLNIASTVDGVVLVASMGESNKQIFKRGVKMLENVDANLLGVVANKIPKKDENYYYSYY